MSQGVELVACFTCGGADRDGAGRTRGERLLEQLHASAAAHGDSDITVSSVRCLWLCKRSCAVHIRSPGRVGYMLAELDENETTARALLDYAAMYGESPDGAVPFKQWPQPLRGHFVCRIPAFAPTDASVSEE